MIGLRNVEKFFAQGANKTYVLRRIDLDIKPGEFVSIMGPSRSGEVDTASHPGDARPVVGRRVLF